MSNSQKSFEAEAMYTQQGWGLMYTVMYKRILVLSCNLHILENVQYLFAIFEGKVLKMLISKRHTNKHFN